MVVLPVATNLVTRQQEAMATGATVRMDTEAMVMGMATEAMAMVAVEAVVTEEDPVAGLLAGCWATLDSDDLGGTAILHVGIPAMEFDAAVMVRTWAVDTATVAIRAIEALACLDVGHATDGSAIVVN